MYQNYLTKFNPSEILVYLRKSRSDDPMLTVEEVLERHETLLNEWQERYLDSFIPQENIFREVVSGESIEDRPQFLKILEMIESPRIKAILVVEVQRLSRGDLEDAGRLMKLLRYTNTMVITPPKTYDLNNEYDRDLFERELKRGNEFLEYSKKIMRRGRELSVSQGWYVNAFPPYGYDRIQVMDGKRKRTTLIENKHQADIVRTIFDLYLNYNMGSLKIAAYLNNLGEKPPKGKMWTPTGISHMLDNVHYIGKVRWDYRPNKTIVEHGQVRVTNPRNKNFTVYDGKHLPIISEEVFYAVRDKIGSLPKNKQGKELRNPFAGILKCRCGRHLQYIGINPKVPNRRPRLTCVHQTYCKSKSIMLEELVDLVVDILQKAIADFKIQLKAESTDSIERHNKHIKSLEKRLEALDQKELAQWNAQTDPDPSKRMPAHIFQKLNAELVAEREKVVQALYEARQNTPQPTNFKERIATFTEALNALKNPKASVQHQNNLLKACIEKMTYFRQRPSKDNPNPQIELEVVLKV